MNIGIFGGTFDPPHIGHLIMAERCLEVAKLDQIWFLPSYRPPHKLDRTMSRFENRFEMTELAIAGHQCFRVNEIERELPPPSYTAETLRVLKERNPSYDFSLIIGGDSLSEFHTWYEPKLIIQRAKLLAIARPGVKHLTSEQLAKSINSKPEEVHLQTVESPLIDISSTDIRNRSRHQQSIRFLVPNAVEVYIREKKLYS